MMGFHNIVCTLLAALQIHNGVRSHAINIYIYTTTIIEMRSVFSYDI